MEITITEMEISTHALREEGDTTNCCGATGTRGFLPTPSARRATGPDQHPLQPDLISTHALREEGD